LRFCIKTNLLLIFTQTEHASFRNLSKLFIMSLSAITKVVLLLAATWLQGASAAPDKSCGHNGECVSLQTGCGYLSSVLTNYVPTCGGNCYQYDSFAAVTVAGNGVFGTDCVIYSDDNCVNEFFDSGNQKGSECYVLSQPGRSMRCFYNC
jgi:hypothetical protein